MKAKIYYILLVGLFLLHPFSIVAAKVNPVASFPSTITQSKADFQEVSQDFSTINALFEDAVDFDDDDDVSFSSRKKYSFETPAFLDSKFNFFSQLHLKQTQFVQTAVLRKSTSFIALNVLRI